MKLGSFVSIAGIFCSYVATVTANGLNMQLDDKASVISGLNLVVKGTLDYYEGNTYGGTVGMFVPPYYWWEAGVAWGQLIDWWYYTGNDTLNSMVVEAMQYQVGKNNDYMPANQTTTEGNDDQGFWGVAAINAAEKNFTNPPDKNDPGWLYLAQAVFNTMAWRWDSQNCGGGLRWQIFTFNSGYDYKNTVSNGCMFHIGARLARYTGNNTYVEWCERIYDWLENVQFITNSSGYLQIFDGGSIKGNCLNHTMLQWTYNYGLLLAGSAYLYDYTNDTKWLTRAENIWQGASVFFQNGIMYEAACQPSGRCNNDQRCFKAIFAEFMGLTARLLPSLANDIMDKMQSSAQAAILSCSGGTDGHTCGLNWFVNGWDDVWGLGEQLSALSVIQNTMALEKPLPLTNRTGGTSKGSSNAGSSSVSTTLTTDNLTITTKDKAGAGVITAVVIIAMLATAFWMLK